MNRSKLAVAAILCLAATAASATSYVPVADRDLADQATAVARVRVVAVEPGPANRPPATDYLVEVDDLVQGYLPGGTIVVRVPGGVRADGLAQKIWGAPELRPGEEALLFLEPGNDGTYGILHLMLGAFHARLTDGVELADRDLSEAHRVGSREGAGEEEAARDLGRFTAWLADRAAGLERAPDYWLPRPTSAVARFAKAYSELPAPDGVPARWFEFDSRGTVAWSVHSAGQPGLGPSQTVANFQAALAAWNADSTSSIELAYAGMTGAAAGMGVPDAVNTVLFDDPNGQVPGTFDCKKGGVLAIAAPYIWPAIRGYRDRRFHEIAEADIVTNDNTECFFADNPQGAAEVLAHELGHTLGFGHATSKETLMWPAVHNDGRGARLGDDDRSAASAFYGDGSFKPEPPPAPAGKLTLKASAARTELKLSWTQPFTGVEQFRVESQKKATFEVVTTVPGDDSTVTVKGLKPNQSYTLRVTAVRADGALAGSSNLVKIRTRK